MSTSGNTWDAAGYDARFGFVTSYGAALLDLLDAHPGELVLDVGCGTGHQAAELAATGVTVVGVDADDDMLATARADHPGVHFVHADAQDPHALEGSRLSDRPFDAVLSNAALHWMPRQDDVTAGIADVLRPGGRLVVEMGGAGNVQRATAAIRAARRDLELDADLPLPWTFPSPAQQAKRLEDHGFVVRLMALFDRTTPLDSGSTPADWARMFGASLTNDVDPATREEFDRQIDTHARGLGLNRLPDGRGGWWIDYVRLRFLAVRN